METHTGFFCLKLGFETPGLCDGRVCQALPITSIRIILLVLQSLAHRNSVIISIRCLNIQGTFFPYQYPLITYASVSLSLPAPL